ncbi:GNAT family N-acetyltransferase [Massilia yuzhufengensis]|uniref:Protein N-acetyltransferase, RimJ/RimL family n=1 Tax=Massilia yuzhufengensis TaxID=1164594 RepID=A0A1I1FSW2_9BURK|nr:GNAT family protein [Massilia yuzhufengensis]SFC00738.1 Protein N-acetyltransferase, RimJ/RimL family [Massilia yuzhufengensis]
MSSYPTPILTTDRLTLRPLTMPDAADLFAVFADPLVVRYWSAEPWTSVSFAETAIRQALDAYRDGSEVRFGIELADTGVLAGTVNLHHFFPQNRRCEIGYALASAYWGKGYATEALEAALDYGFHELRLNRVEADIDPRNAASAAVLERMGFRKEGYMPERWIVHGEMADTVNYGLLRSYWDARA